MMFPLVLLVGLAGCGPNSKADAIDVGLICELGDPVSDCVGLEADAVEGKYRSTDPVAFGSPALAVLVTAPSGFVERMEAEFANTVCPVVEQRLQATLGEGRELLMHEWRGQMQTVRFAPSFSRPSCVVVVEPRRASS